MSNNPNIGGAPATYQSDSDSDSDEEYAAYRSDGQNNVLASLKADEAKSPDSTIQSTEVCEDYFDADEDETAPDLISRQVLARKSAATGGVSKLLCDEVDGAVKDASAAMTELANDNIFRALSRGKSMGGIGSRGGGRMARSKSQFGSAARADREARDKGIGRGMDNNSETMNEMMSKGDAVRRVVRTRGSQGPAALGPKIRSFKSGDEALGENGRRKSNLDMLNAMAEDEPVPPRKQSIRFA